MQVNVTCEDISLGTEYKYTAPALGSLQQMDTEVTWQAPDYKVLGHSNFLILPFCETGIRLTLEYIFNVINSTRPTSDSSETPEGHSGFIIITTTITTIIVVLLSLLLIGGLFRLTRRERCRDWWRSACRCVFTRVESHNIPLEEVEAGNREIQPLNIKNPNHDHAVSADQNGDPGRMLIQDQTSESDKGPQLPSNQNNGDCATLNMNGYGNDGMKKCRSSNC
ncbi:uncharacterized protein LOC132842610 isoform X2 [Tachysurus vachellii]|uniref:uncharacterized protein LOC132842610 isoform X2 n=1 Tax=Tachysurus vachellii TaxID=175792 RepID=UPI00296B3E9C|nr:uncharacterized protein LOC132842610 isoform X2 [Tachysurus vachellii]